MTPAFIGLGTMGKPMALNLLRSLQAAGGSLIVSDASDRHFAEFERAGAQPTRDPARIADAQTILLSLPDGEVVRQVLLGANGLLPHLRAGQVVVDTSTIAYGTTLEVAAALAANGVVFIDAPVSGMEARAVDATLTVMAGGDAAAFDAVRPLLAAMGNKILHLGAVGSGQLAKLINQLLFDVNCAALAEILPMAVKKGLDPVKVGEIVNSGTGRSHASEFFVPRVLQGRFDAGYPMKNAYKDLVSAAEIGAREGIPMPVLAAATATYQQALLRGHGKLDKGGMIRVFEDLLGVEFRGPASAANSTEGTDR